MRSRQTHSQHNTVGKIAKPSTLPHDNHLVKHRWTLQAQGAASPADTVDDPRVWYCVIATRSSPRCSMGLPYRGDPGRAYRAAGSSDDLDRGPGLTLAMMAPMMAWQAAAESTAFSDGALTAVTAITAIPAATTA
jgi:hypothetical protein